MQFQIVATTLAISACLLGSGLPAQAARNASDVAILGLVHRTMNAKLPAGRHVITLDDPLLRIPKGQENIVEGANRELANSVGLPAAALNAVLTCSTAHECAFKDNIVATISLKMLSRTEDSAVVEVATRHFSATLRNRPGSTAAWQSIALYEVRVARQGVQWVVISVTPRMES